MGERRSHLPHFTKTRHMRQLSLHLVEPALGLGALGEVADKAGEDPLARYYCFTNRQLYREDAAVLAPRRDHPADADDPSLARLEITIDIRIMELAVRRGHQR